MKDKIFLIKTEHEPTFRFANVADKPKFVGYTNLPSGRYSMFIHSGSITKPCFRCGAPGLTVIVFPRSPAGRRFICADCLREKIKKEEEWAELGL